MQALALRLHLGGMVFRLVGGLARLLSSLVSIILLAIIATAGYVVYQSKQQDTTTTDAIVVLGAAQYEGVPSPVLANRLDHALELAATGVAPIVITVGGKQPGDRFTEASAGREYLIDSGLLSDQVVAIPTGRDTLTSLQAVANYALKNNLHSVTVVSDPAHVARVKAIAERLGLYATISPTQSGPGSEVTPEYLIREVGGLLQFWLVGAWTS